MIQNAWRAMKLDVDFFNTVEHDEELTGQAAMVVFLVGILNGLGRAATKPGFIFPLLGGILATLVGWLIWSWLSSWIARTFFDATTDTGEMLRVLGYAYAPLLLGIFPRLAFVGAVWSLVIAVVAIREAGDFTTGKAVVTLIAGWIIGGILLWILPGI